MDMEASQHQENMANASLENMLVCTNGQQDGKKPRPQPEQALKCPRCDSTNTKFCYYNNYSLTQPRYFCKSCRRYWTKGGTLRNVPVGGGCRKNKRSSATRRTPDQIQPNPLTGIPPALSYDAAGDHLSLAFARLQKSGGQLGFDNEIEVSGIMGNPGNSHGDINSPVTPGFLDTMRSGFVGNNNNFQNFCYGFGAGNIGGDRNVGGDMMVPAYEYDQDSSRYNGTASQGVTAELMKQEFASNVGKFDGANFNYYGGNVNVGEFENGGRESWNGINASWHGLLNSPLMM